MLEHAECQGHEVARPTRIGADPRRHRPAQSDDGTGKGNCSSDEGSTMTYSGQTGLLAWAYDDLLTNTTRGVLAEYIVATALGICDTKRVDGTSTTSYRRYRYRGEIGCLRANVEANPAIGDRVQHPPRTGLGRPRQHLCGQCGAKRRRVRLLSFSRVRTRNASTRSTSRTGRSMCCPRACSTERSDAEDDSARAAESPPSARCAYGELNAAIRRQQRSIAAKSATRLLVMRSPTHNPEHAVNYLRDTPLAVPTRRFGGDCGGVCLWCWCASS